MMKFIQPDTSQFPNVTFFIQLDFIFNASPFSRLRPIQKSPCRFPHPPVACDGAKAENIGTLLIRELTCMYVTLIAD
jgi:hypothetical protein